MGREAVSVYINCLFFFSFFHHKSPGISIPPASGIVTNGRCATVGSIMRLARGRTATP